MASLETYLKAGVSDVTAWQLEIADEIFAIDAAMAAPFAKAVCQDAEARLKEQLANMEPVN